MKGKSDKARRANQERVLQKWIPDTKANRKTSYRDPASAKV